MKRFDSVQGRINLIFLTFSLLVVLSVGATFWGIQTQRTDALIINLAGRQRMLTQKITWLALAQPGSPELSASVRLFEETLNALRYGGPAAFGVAADLSAPGEVSTVVLPNAPDSTLAAELDEATRLWDDFRHHLEPLDIQALQAASPSLLAHLDRIVSQYEERAEAKLGRVNLIQGISLLAGLALLMWGYLLTRKRIFAPLVQLGAAARRMEAGQLAEPVPPIGDDELGKLVHAFESMRAEVASVHEHLESRVAQRTRELAAAFELSQEIVAQLELDRLLRSVTERARLLTHARAAALCLLNQDGSMLVLEASSPEDEAHINLQQSLQREPARCVVCTGEPVVAQAECLPCAFLHSQAPGQSAVAPLRAGETTIGALCVVRDSGQAFDRDETRALTLLSNSAAIAITNARLVETGRSQAEQAAKLSERERLAEELHDNLAQTLSFLNVQTDRVAGMMKTGDVDEGLSQLERMKEAIGGAYLQVRAALVGLSEPLPNADDFAHKLSENLDEIRHATGLHVALEVADASALELPRMAQAQAIRIMREALANASKHSQAQNVRVCIERMNGQSRFIIEDDGRGFDPQDVQGNSHLGLRLMRARAERSGGTLEVESAPGKGTRVVVCFPIKDA